MARYTIALSFEVEPVQEAITCPKIVFKSIGLQFLGDRREDGLEGLVADRAGRSGHVLQRKREDVLCLAPRTIDSALPKEMHIEGLIELKYYSSGFLSPSFSVFPV